MTRRPPSIDSTQRSQIWKHVYAELIQHAIPDSRFHYDFLSYTPDFRNSSYAIDQLVELPSYKAANTLLVTPDSSLEQLRYRALKDGKKLLVATYRLRRGFVLLNPSRIGEEEYRVASWLDGMERPGVGRAMSLAQMQQEGIEVDLAVTGGLAFNVRGVVVWEGAGLFEVQWAMLQDVKVLRPSVPVAAVAHQCQVVDEAEHGFETIDPVKVGEVQCDYVITPERVFEIGDVVKPADGIDFDTVDPDALDNIPPLQELKGIRIMEQIMSSADFPDKVEEQQQQNGEKSKKPSAEEQMGMDMIDKIMKGYKVG